MLDVILDGLKKLIKSRLFPVSLVYIALFSILVNQLFVLQIVKGPALAKENDYRETESRELKSTRGNIYDRNGKLLASNVLSYSVTMEDNTEIKSNKERNAIIHRLIQIIKKNDDTLDNPFPIRQNADGEFEFTVSGTALTRFKKNAYTFVLTDDRFKDKYLEATAEEVYEFLRNGTGDDYTSMFGISDEYSVEETLEIMSVRYALHINYPKFLRITVASKVTDSTVAEVMENSAELTGVEIQQQTQRVYHDSVYFAHILGYTGLINSEELDALNQKEEYYYSTDIIGKTGLEAKYESYLGGKKGSEIVAINSNGKVLDVVDRIEPVAGNDLYLTIDSDLQRSSYNILEKKIAGILISKLRPDMNYGSKGEDATDILIPIYEVYYALINNDVIDINQLDDEDAEDLEKQVYNKYKDNLVQIFDRLDTLLSVNNTVTNSKAGEMEDYLNYFYKVLTNNEILLKKSIPDDDVQLQSYINGKISLSSFLQYAIANNYIDLAKLNVGNEYYSSEEQYNRLLDYTKDILEADPTFNKMIYKNLIFTYKLSGKEICLLLFEQGVLEYNQSKINALEAGSVSAYDFMLEQLTSLAITPAMLALEPCSGSLVITDVKTGDLLALVTYPSYDNNKLANKVDPAYYKRLLNDKSFPLRNRPIKQGMAPGSTFKMVTSVAGLEENVVTPSETIRDLGIFEKAGRTTKCHIFPGSHGSVNLAEALKVSCNYYFYEVGYRLSIDNTGRFKDQVGLSKLKDYASMFGLDTTSGVELDEVLPSISDEDSIRSSIGQGSNVFTPIQLARYVTTLANRGVNYNLTLLDKIVDKDGNTILHNSAKIYKKLTDIKESTWDSVQEGMYNVVNTPGGSVYSQYHNLGVTVAGKTGTSQISKFVPNNALFVSYAPFENPEISVTAVIPNGYTSGNAADLTKDIYRLYFDLQDPNDLVEKEASVPENNIADYID